MSVPVHDFEPNICPQSNPKHKQILQTILLAIVLKKIVQQFVEKYFCFMRYPYVQRFDVGLQQIQIQIKDLSAI